VGRDSSGGRGRVPEIQGRRTVGRRKKLTREEKRGSERGAKPAAEKGHGKPQKLITDINTLTPWTLLLMYFLPFRPTGAHSIYRSGGAAAYTERIFRRKNPLFPHAHRHTRTHKTAPPNTATSIIILLLVHTHTHRRLLRSSSILP